MSTTNSILDTFYNDYLLPFVYHANATAQRNELIAPLIREASVNKILFLCVGFAILIILLSYAVKSILYVRRHPNEPPIVPYWFPIIGSAVTMGMDPIKFYRKYQQEVRMVTCLGAEGNNFVFNAKLADASAEAAYKSLTVPVFGKGVVYDVHNSVLMEQKKFVKSGLSNENLRAYVPMIEMETKNYFSRWNKTSDIQDIHKATAELIIMTASRCLLGDEVRSKLDESFAQIFHDLDGGFKPINFLFEDLPLQSNKLRDVAHVKMRHFFMNIMKDRREKGVTDRTDIMQYLTTNCQYKNGRKLSDEESAHIMIAMLMAGQHTSSTTTAWALLYLAAQPNLFNELRQEQIDILGSLDEPLTFDEMKKLTLHDNVVRETLRLRPPILNIIRKVIKDLPVPGTQYVIPKDSFIQALPTISQRSEDYFENAETFNPNRWIDFDQHNKERDDDLVDYGFGILHSASAKSPFLPFGAGRHRCIGEPFAYLQIKTILAVFVRMFDLGLHENKFPECDFTTMMVQPKNPLVQYTRRE
ncbi:10438_t:CDS:2 [Funneliformis geosporum]|uniref:10438_t:CDS:1 n=1 Tax=Funneliformis geosporum TaxID=1117311 RepID=A0A9W4SQ27_9GLOM|nr:10438_t:CDS:2 [Funneliformis geosporum]